MHPPAMLILGAGGALLPPLVPGHPDGGTDILLAVPAGRRTLGRLDRSVHHFARVDGPANGLGRHQDRCFR
ncbi:hypothetical protein ACIRL2_39085 [Embleya sp. NPDC127516]|uniref:hypothetical protein n=1 Tax=Embleya sp. NPDC127516 TaxID=3363990 RepID=UPI003823EC9F